MHGRVKVRTSEEEKARKDKERQAKLKVFKHAMKTIQNKRKEGELDNELLDLTDKVLCNNPDIYTLWNIRKEILQIFRKNIESEEEMSKKYDSELSLTEYCLKINPKSYCVWHHRVWVLKTRLNPDWKKELDLCNTYLKLDGRNFPTWDYRRFVVSQYKPPLKDEFDYTTEKLFDNFSNYSAWHYRSKMLVELYPDLEGGRPIEDSHHKHELKMVQSAAFTDPDDTSAWFYQRWLLGAVKSVVQLVNCTVTPCATTVAFNKHVSKHFVHSRTQLYIADSLVSGEWVACTGADYDNLWIFKHSVSITDNLDVKVEFETDKGEKDMIICISQTNAKYVGKANIDFQKNYSAPVVEELNNQLDSCRQLLALEPDSKWTLLTTTVFLHCIDPKLYHNEVIDNLKTLKTIDKFRSGYYDDLITKWSIEEYLSNLYKDSSLDLKLQFPIKLTSLPHLQYFSYCENVDFSNQELTAKVLPSLVVLQNCKNLSLENNKLTSLKGFPNLPLKELNLKGNELSFEEVEQFRKKCKYSVLF